MSQSDCLHCKINDLVQQHVEGMSTEINLPDLIAKATESLVDLILLGPEEEWCNLLAEANRQVGQAFLEKSGAVDEGSETAH